MRQRLLLTVALAVLATVTVAGGVSAQVGEVVGTGQDAVDVTLENGQKLLPACSNQQDDDGDGAVDTSDPGCSSAVDTS